MRSRRFGIVGLAVAMGLIAAACQITVDAHTLTVVQAQEDGFFGNGDEPYVAVIEFRSTPSVPGSTSVQFLGNLDELGSGMDDGDAASIPDAMGRAHFDSVTPVSFETVLAGTLPEVLGTVMVVWESDFTPWSIINNLMDDVAASLQTELAAVVETLTITDLTSPSTVADALAQAAANVEDSVEPSILEQIGIWFASLGNPDDLIGIGFTVWLPTVGPLSTAIESSLLTALPASAVGGVWTSDLDPIQRTLRFSGDDAIYDVELTATAAL